MEAIDALVNRVSCSKLQSPPPSAEQRQVMYRAALRAADHGKLRPYRFLEVEGEGLQALGAVFERAAEADDPSLTVGERERFRNMPLRAPLIIVAIASYKEHRKVPDWEQMVTAGAAVQNIINAAFVQGIGAYWRTGALANHQNVLSGLEIQDSEFVIGFIYLGTPAVVTKPAPDLSTEDFFQAWPVK